MLDTLIHHDVPVELAWLEEDAHEADPPTEESTRTVTALFEDGELTLFEVAEGAGGDRLELTVTLTPELLAAILEYAHDKEASE